MADYLSSVSGPAAFNYVSFALAAAAFVVFDGARSLWRGKGCALNAGACLTSYVVMVALLYHSYPTYFAPLHSVFGLVFGAAVMRLSRRVGVPVFALDLAAALPFGWNTVQTIAASASNRAYLNLTTERRLLRYLTLHPAPEALHVTIDNMFGGVTDSISGGRIRTAQASALFTDCNRPDAAPTCAPERVHALLCWAGIRSVRLIIADTRASQFHANAGLSGPGFVAVARTMGYRTAVEALFATPSGAPGLVVYRLDPSLHRAATP